MAQTATRDRCVAGRVKTWQNSDGSFTVKVAGKYGVRFVLAGNDPNTAVLRASLRALVRYEEHGRTNKVKFVLANPSSRLIQQHMLECTAS